jgi:hypothetical protein
MDAGRVRTVLGCGNPKVSKWHAQACRRIPTPLRSGSLRRMSRPLKLKVAGAVLTSAFQLPDHGFARAVCGGAPQTFSLTRSRRQIWFRCRFRHHSHLAWATSLSAILRAVLSAMIAGASSLQVVVRIPSCALRGGASPGPLIEISYPHVYEERILHGRMSGICWKGRQQLQTL